MVNILLLGTCDTKLKELLFLRDEIQRNSAAKVILLDVGSKESDHHAITIPRQQLIKEYGAGEDQHDQSSTSRNDAIELVSKCAAKAVKKLFDQQPEANTIHGIVAVGGSCGTSIASAVMRSALPIGFPKLIVSTIASGDTGPIVEDTDITLMYSVVDVAGLNQLLRKILRNAAAAILGMAEAFAMQPKSPVESTKKRVGITMFGVTTPAADAIRKHLESTYTIETFIFHATGHGGKAMERLVKEGSLDAVIDLTTTEICDFLTGGVMSAGPNRLEAAAEAGIPNIISVGAVDMTNFGAKNTVPDMYKQRTLYVHNPLVTLMRTSEDEARAVGDYICKKLKAHAKKTECVQVWLPLGGVSMISTPGGPFADVKADEVLFESVKSGLEGSGIEVVEKEHAINDPEFAHSIAEALVAMMGLRRT